MTLLLVTREETTRRKTSARAGDLAANEREARPTKPYWRRCVWQSDPPPANIRSQRAGGSAPKRQQQLKKQRSSRRAPQHEAAVASREGPAFKPVAAPKAPKTRAETAAPAKHAAGRKRRQHDCAGLAQV